MKYQVIILGKSKETSGILTAYFDACFALS